MADHRALHAGAHIGTHGRIARARSALDRAVRRAAAYRPAVVVAALVALDLAAALAFTGTGRVLGDPALLHREGMPGTWLSFAQLSLIAYVSWTTHAVERPGGAWHGDLWGLAAVVFAAFALDEILGTSQLVGTWLNQEAGLSPAGPFEDLGAVLLTLAFAAAALVLLPRALILLRRPLAALLLAIGVALGAASQALDSFVTPTAWELAAEESLKRAAEAFLLAGFLAALRAALRAAAPPPPAAASRRPPSPARPRRP